MLTQPLSLEALVSTHLQDPWKTCGRACARMETRIRRKLRICTDRSVTLRPLRVIRGSLVPWLPLGQAMVIPETTLQLALQS